MSSGARDIADEMRRLRSVALTRLTNAPDETMERLASLVARLLDASVGLVSLVDDHRQFFPGQSGLDAPWSDSRETPLSHSMCKTVVESSEMLQIDDATTDTRWSEHAAHTVLGVQSYLGAPLLDASGMVLGSLCVIEPKPRVWSAEDRQVLEDLAFGASSELRARISVTEARLATARVELMAEVTTAMLSTLDPQDSIEAMLDIVVARMANWAFVFLRSDDDAPERIVVRHRQPEMAASLLDWLADGPRSVADMPLTMSVLSGSTSSLLVDGPSAVLAARGRPDSEAFERMGMASLIVVPMVLANEIIGTMVLVAHPDDQEFDAIDLTVASDLAQRAATAFDHARIYAREKRVAHALQRSLLPTMPVVDAAGVDTLYTAAAQGIEVGGDWYDLIVLPDGSLVATIGDVTGHSITAAAAMGRVQVALRLMAMAGNDPVRIVEGLASVAGDLLGDLLATCLVLHLRRATPAGGWSIDIANAGHLPPVVVTADGTATIVDLPHDGLLGLARRGAVRHLTTVHVPAGSTLILYTDGLIEHRLEPIDDALSRLQQAAGAHGSGPITGLCQRLLDELQPSGSDDIACIALRL